MPALERFTPCPPFGGKTNHTWALIHGTSVTAAHRILLEGFIRPTDRTFNPDPKQSQLPTFGAYALGIEIARSDTQVPQWAALDLMDRASKKGKGQLPIFIGSLYKGKEARLSLSAGGKDMAQLKIPSVGTVTTSEKYTLTHSRHRSICFLAVTWDQFQPSLGQIPRNNRWKPVSGSENLPQNCNLEVRHLDHEPTGTHSGSVSDVLGFPGHPSL